MQIDEYNNFLTYLVNRDFVSNFVVVVHHSIAVTIDPVSDLENATLKQM